MESMIAQYKILDQVESMEFSHSNQIIIFKCSSILQKISSCEPRKFWFNHLFLALKGII